MKIAINCLEIDPRYKGGLTTYTFGLLNGFAQVPAKHRFLIYCHDTNSSLFEAFEGRLNFEIRCLRAPSIPARASRRIAVEFASSRLYRGAVDAIWRSATRDIDRHADLMYTPTTVFSAFDFNVPGMVSMHDIQQVHFPQFFTKTELKGRKLAFEATAAKATYVQASSEFIREDLLEHFESLKQEQIIVINEGVEIDVFQRPSTSLTDLCQRYKIPERFLFFPAQLWPHKNHITVLKALKLLRDRGRDTPLVMTGAKFSAADSIFRFIEQEKLTSVHYLGLVPFADLVGLYQAAQFLVTAVLYESSSLPILEAAAAGTPIIASRTPPNEELARNLQLNLFEPQDAQQLADLIEGLWVDDIGERQRTSNLKAIHRYSWASVAEKYLQFFDGLS